MILTLFKNTSNDENRFRRINVQKIGSLKDLLNKPIEKVTFDIKSIHELDEIKKFLEKKGDTLISINFSDEKKILNIQLKNRRNLDRKSLNLLKNKEISSKIE